MTTSYGFDETDISATLAKFVPYQSCCVRRKLNQSSFSRLCNAYMALGARGVSILFASGPPISSYAVHLITNIQPITQVTAVSLAANVSSLAKKIYLSPLIITPQLKPAQPLSPPSPVAAPSTPPSAPHRASTPKSPPPSAAGASPTSSLARPTNPPPSPPT